jgi:hypothetical protein
MACVVSSAIKSIRNRLACIGQITAALPDSYANLSSEIDDQDSGFLSQLDVSVGFGDGFDLILPVDDGAEFSGFRARLQTTDESPVLPAGTIMALTGRRCSIRACVAPVAPSVVRERSSPRSDKQYFNRQFCCRHFSSPPEVASRDTMPNSADNSGRCSSQIKQKANAGKDDVRARKQNKTRLCHMMFSICFVFL